MIITKIISELNKVKLPDINSKYYKNEVFNQYSFSNKTLYLLKGGQEDDKDYCMKDINNISIIKTSCIMSKMSSLDFV